MAKGNMLQGMARGKVGDVVFSRLNGEQVSRVRNRHPLNPRTNKQLVQRAIMATVMQMYSAGKVIFDHSFQGKSVGAECQREFMSLNAKALREAIANDLNQSITTSAAKGRVVAPGQQSPVPFDYIVSRGNYDQTLFSVRMYGDSTPAPTAYIPEATDGATLAQYATAHNILPGDIYTFIAVGASRDVTEVSSKLGDLASTPKTRFGFIRLIVKDDVLESTKTDWSWSDIFEQEESNGATLDLDSKIAGSKVDTDEVTGNSDLTAGALGVIRSRRDQDLRSNTTLASGTRFGIIAPFITEVWAQGTTAIGNSELILEGGNF